ncbi:MAG TPA: nuclear transport factor 2 family protein [Gemmatimonadales bacterium]|nr:nuclear transport factor 2 family protein [Gemmatimonadales bacterium]
MTRAAAALIVACASGGCTRAAPVPATGPTTLETGAVRDVIAAALAADAAMQDADSLYLVGASVIADGQTRIGPPRFAGIRSRGRANISASAIEITGVLAWASVEYRWGGEAGGAGVGRATLVLERLGGAWRIKHVHSSTARPPGG